MILDNLKTSLCDYGDMGVKLCRAFEWLKGNDLKSLETGQVITIDGGRIFAQILGYRTRKQEECFFETHRSFIDIQYMVSGKERVDWTPLARLTRVKTPYNVERDLIFFEEPDFCSSMVLHEDEFMVFFPSDGHRPSCMVDSPEEVKKIVVKVAAQ